mmetsp:Transcript_44340/g.143027  ORF Transcript_44340/g.143027 Transcript_44340/m.143027 type:complete len:391 (-) Transcript_44340:3-1175(-)
MHSGNVGCGSTMVDARRTNIGDVAEEAVADDAGTGVAFADVRAQTDSQSVVAPGDQRPASGRDRPASYSLLPSAPRAGRRRALSNLKKKERKQTTQGRDGRTARRHHTGILRRGVWCASRRPPLGVCLFSYRSLQSRSGASRACSRVFFLVFRDLGSHVCGSDLATVHVPDVSWTCPPTRCLEGRAAPGRGRGRRGRRRGAARRPAAPAPARRHARRQPRRSEPPLEREACPRRRRRRTRPRTRRARRRSGRRWPPPAAARRAATRRGGRPRPPPSCPPRSGLRERPAARRQSSRRRGERRCTRAWRGRPSPPRRAGCTAATPGRSACSLRAARGSRPARSGRRARRATRRGAAARAQPRRSSREGGCGGEWRASGTSREAQRSAWREAA